MTVKELTEYLSKLDPDLRVFTRGYEGGYEDARMRDRIHDFHLNHYKEWYMGPHEVINEKSKTETVRGIIL